MGSIWRLNMEQQQVIDELWEHIFNLRDELNKYKDYSERLEKEIGKLKGEIKGEINEQSIFNRKTNC